MERASIAAERVAGEIDWPSSWEDLVAKYQARTPEERAARDEARRREAESESARKRREHLRDLYRRLSEIDEKYRECTLDSFVPRSDGQKKALEAAWRVAEDPDHIGLGLTGTWGQAKSILTASIVNTCNERLIPSVFVTWVNFIDLLRETYDNDGRLRKGKREILEQYAAAHVLVVDDIDKVPLTVDVAGHMFRLLDRRDKAKRPLIVTANYPLADLANAWRLCVGVNRIEQRPPTETTGAIYRRLKELCGTWIHLSPEKGNA